MSSRMGKVLGDYEDTSGEGRGAGNECIFVGTMLRPRPIGRKRFL